MQARRLELLQRMPVFGGLREDSLTLLLDHARVVAAQAGDCYFRENDQADSMFVLETGRVKVVKGWQGREFVLHELAAGGCFGEMALMDLHPRSASVRAVEDSRAIEIGASDLLHLFERDVEQFALIQMNIGREVCRRLRVTDERLFRVCMGETTVDPGTLFRAA